MQALYVSLASQTACCMVCCQKKLALPIMSVNSGYIFVLFATVGASKYRPLSEN